MTEGSSADTQPIRMLALSSERFRGDLEILSSLEDVFLYSIAGIYQAKLSAFLNLRRFPYNKQAEKHLFFDLDTNSVSIKYHERLNKLMTPILKSLYSKLGINMIISAALHYRRDFEWGDASEKIGVKYLVFHKECMKTNFNHHCDFVNYWKNKGVFPGSHIIFHNEIMKNLLIRSGYATNNMISVCGPLRMDSFMNKINSSKKINHPTKRKSVVLFSFSRGVGLTGNMQTRFLAGKSVGYCNLFENVHRVFAMLALKYPNVDFIVKSKLGGRAIKEIEAVWMRNDIDYPQVDNLTIMLNSNTTEIILNSDVCCGFGSTTLLESAICEKAVIVPLFDEALDTRYKDYIQFQNEMHIFDVANNISDFKRLIEERLQGYKISPDCMKERRSTFEKYVGPLDGSSTEHYHQLLKKIVKIPDNSTKKNSIRDYA